MGGRDLNAVVIAELERDAELQQRIWLSIRLSRHAAAARLKIYTSAVTVASVKWPALYQYVHLHPLV